MKVGDLVVLKNSLCNDAIYEIVYVPVLRDAYHIQLYKPNDLYCKHILIVDKEWITPLGTLIQDWTPKSIGMDLDGYVWARTSNGAIRFKNNDIHVYKDDELKDKYTEKFEDKRLFLSMCSI